MALKRRRAVHITTVHRWFDPRIFEKECRTLAEAGWRVTLIAPGSADHSRDGVRIRAIRQRPGRVLRMTMMALDAFRAVRREEADVIHVHDPELIPLALMLRLLGRQVVYDSHEDLPLQISGKPWIPHWLVRPMAMASAALVRIAGRGVSAVVAATEVVARRFPPSRTVVIHNFPATVHVPRLTGANLYADRSADVAYVGGLSTARGLRQMLEAMDSLPPELGARLHLAGRFQPASLEIQTSRFRGASHAIWHGWLDADDVAALLENVRVGLCVLQPLPNYVDSLPTKLFEYMAASLPVVASDFSPWKAIIDGAGCGLLVDPSDPTAIASAIERLLRDVDTAAEMGRRGRKAVLSQYTWEAEAAKLTALYDRMVPAG